MSAIELMAYVAFKKSGGLVDSTVDEALAAILAGNEPAAHLTDVSGPCPDYSRFVCRALAGYARVGISPDNIGAPGSPAVAMFAAAIAAATLDHASRESAVSGECRRAMVANAEIARSALRAMSGPAPYLVGYLAGADELSCLAARLDRTVGDCAETRAVVAARDAATALCSFDDHGNRIGPL